MSDSQLTLRGEFSPNTSYILQGSTLVAWREALIKDRVVPGPGLLESQTPQRRIIKLQEAEKECGWEPFVPDSDEPLEIGLIPAFVFLGGGGRAIKHVMPTLDLTPSDVEDRGLKLDNDPIPLFALSNGTEYKLYLIYRYYEDEDPTTDETYARIVVLEDQQNIVDIATADEKWVLLGELETENGFLKPPSMLVCGPETFGGGGGGTVSCTNLLPRLRNVAEEGQTADWRLSVSYGIIQPEIPTINGVEIHIEDGNGDVPYFSVNTEAALWLLIDWEPVEGDAVGGGYYYYYYYGGGGPTVLAGGRPFNMRFIYANVPPSPIFPEIDPDIQGLMVFRWADVVEEIDDEGLVSYRLLDAVCGNAQPSLCIENRTFILRFDEN